MDSSALGGPPLIPTMTEADAALVTSTYASQPFGVSNVPVGDIQFKNTEGVEYKYKPTEDITPYEIAMLMRMFVILLAGSGSYDYSIWDYVVEHKLEKHFVPTTSEI